MLEIKDCYFIKEVHKIIFHPEIRFLFQDCSKTCLYLVCGGTQNQGMKWFPMFHKLGWQGFCCLNAWKGHLHPLCSQLFSCSSVKGQLNRWVVTILGWEQGRRRSDCSLQEQSVASAVFVAAASAFFTTAAGVKPSVPEFCQHMWITLTCSYSVKISSSLHIEKPRDSPVSAILFSKNSAPLYTCFTDDIFIVFPIMLLIF